MSGPGLPVKGTAARRRCRPRQQGRGSRGSCAVWDRSTPCCSSHAPQPCLCVAARRLDFGSKPIERQLILSAQFLHNELPVRLSHRVAELENLPYGLSAKPHVLKVCSCEVVETTSSCSAVRQLTTSGAQLPSMPAGRAAKRPRQAPPGIWCLAWPPQTAHAHQSAAQGPPTLELSSSSCCRLWPHTIGSPPRTRAQVRDWYVESFRELRGFPKVRDASDELQFTRLLQHIYRRHTNVVPVMAMGVAGARAARGRRLPLRLAFSAAQQTLPAVPTASLRCIMQACSTGAGLELAFACAPCAPTLATAAAAMRTGHTCIYRCRTEEGAEQVDWCGGPAGHPSGGGCAPPRRTGGAANRARARPRLYLESRLSPTHTGPPALPHLRPPVPGQLLHVAHRHPHAHRPAHRTARAAGEEGESGGCAARAMPAAALDARPSGRERHCSPPVRPVTPAAHHLQRENHIGLIDTKCSPAGVCQDAIDDARSICMREKGSAPEVTVYGDPSFTFPYVPSHLHHMVGALPRRPGHAWRADAAAYPSRGRWLGPGPEVGRWAGGTAGCSKGSGSPRPGGAPAPLSAVQALAPHPLPLPTSLFSAGV